MKIPAPHFLLFSESNPKSRRGDWRFVLQSVDGLDKIEAADIEPDVNGERLELLTVVRGLEALERPARVTIITPSKYVSRGMMYGLEEWRSNAWQWESFGEMVPVKNQDLWRRIDRAMAIHQIDCRAWRFDGVADDFQTPEAQPLISSEPILQSPSRSPNAKSDGLGARLPAGTVHPLLGDKLLLRRNATSAQAIGSRSLRRRLKRWSISLQRRLRGGMERFYQSLAEFGTELLPKPWFQ